MTMTKLAALGLAAILLASPAAAATRAERAARADRELAAIFVRYLLAAGATGVIRARYPEPRK